MNEDEKRDAKESIRRSIKRFMLDTDPEEFPGWRFMKVPGLENKVITILVPMSGIKNCNGSTDKINELVERVYELITISQRYLDTELIETIGRDLREYDKYNYLNQLSIYILLGLIKEYGRKKRRSMSNSQEGLRKGVAIKKSSYKKVSSRANILRIRLRIENILQENINGLYIYNDMINWGEAQYQFISDFESIEKAEVGPISSDSINEEIDSIEKNIINYEKVNKRKFLFRHYLEDLSSTLINNMNLSKISLQEFEVLLGIKDIKKNDNISIGLEKLIRESLSVYVKSSNNPRVPPFVSIPSSKLYHGISAAIVAKSFKKQEGQKWYHTTLSSDTKTIIESYLLPDLIIREPERDKDIIGDVYTAHLETIKEYADKMGDLTVDVMDAIYVILLMEAKTVSDWVVIDADSILKLRGMQPKISGSGRYGGYKDEQRQEIIKHIKILSSILVTEDYTINKQKQKTSSPVIEITKDFIGHISPYVFSIRSGGAMSKSIGKNNRQTALISQKVLNYDWRNNQLEKRLARYFAWLWRIRQKDNSYFKPVKVETILKDISWNIYHESKSKTNDRVNKAFDKLKNDGVIADWDIYNKDSNIKDEEVNSGQILDKSVIIEPPQTILDHYSKIEKKRISSKKTEIDSSLITQIRKDNGYTYILLADQIKVPPDSIFKLETGYAKDILDNDISKIKKWINTIIEQEEPS